MIEFLAHKAIIKSFCTHRLWFRSRHVLWILFIFAKLRRFGLSGLILGNRSFSLIDLSSFTLGTQHVLCRLSGIFMTRMALCCHLCKACVRYANDICTALYIFSLRQTFALHQMLAASVRNMEREDAYHTEFCVIPQKHLKRSDLLFIYSFVNMEEKCTFIKNKINLFSWPKIRFYVSPAICCKLPFLFLFFLPIPIITKCLFYYFQSIYPQGFYCKGKDGKKL